MKELITYILFFLFVSISYSQTTIDVRKNYIEVTATFDSIYTPTSDIIFRSRIAPYRDSLLTMGLHFKNNSKTVIMNKIKERTETDSTCTDFNACQESQWYDSPIIGVHGAGTKVIYRGPLFKADNSRCDASIVVWNYGHFLLGKQAVVDAVFYRWGNFTRSIYVHSDGTGIFEIEPGFISDRSQKGTKNVSFGAIRFNNATFITHTGESLPYYYRPKFSDPDGFAKINSHCVFENSPGSKWIVKSNNQYFPGGFWANENMTLETQKDLIITGVIDTFKYNENYVNYGGMMFFNTNRTITKIGSAKLKLACDQAYSAGSKYIVNEGAVEFATNPYMYGTFHFTKFKDFYTGRNLIIDLNNNSELITTAKDVHLNTLNVNSTTAIVTVKQNSLLHVTTAKWSGTLKVIITSPTQLADGTIIKVLDVTNKTGTFNQVVDSANFYIWDTQDLYTKGEIKVNGYIGFRENKMVKDQFIVYPNPTHNEIHFSTNQMLYYNNCKLIISDLANKEIDNYTFINQNTISLSTKNYNNGMYLYKIFKDKILIQSGKFIVSK